MTHGGGAVKLGTYARGPHDECDGELQEHADPSDKGYALSVQPDLLVLAPDAPNVALVAEVRHDLADREALEAQLREYMLDNRCGFALLVTPAKTWIYKDTLHDFTAASIREVGEFDTAEVLSVTKAPTTEPALFQAVRDWLERLASAWSSALPKASGPRKSVVEYLVPAVAEGRILSGSLR